MWKGKQGKYIVLFIIGLFIGSSFIGFFISNTINTLKKNNVNTDINAEKTIVRDVSTNHNNINTTYNEYYTKRESQSYFPSKSNPRFWSATEVVSTESTSYTYFPSICVDNSGTVHVVWEDATNYAGSGWDTDIFYRYKPSGGVWSGTEVVSTESTDSSFYPSICVDNSGTVHVVWSDYTDYDSCGSDPDIFYKYKLSGGVWSGTEVVSTESTGYTYFPSIYVDYSGVVHVVWIDETNYFGCGNDRDIFYKYKNSDGTWSNVRVVSACSSSSSDEPSICVDSSGMVYIIWTDEENYFGCGSDPDIFYRYKPSGGIWSSTKVLTTENEWYSSNPSICVDNSGTVHVTWVDDILYGGFGYDYDIFYKYKPSGGAWSGTEVVSTESTHISFFPSMCVDNSGTVHVTWLDFTDYDGCGSDHDIFYKYKPSGGVWSGTEVVSTESTNNSWDPSMCVDNSGRVHVVWEDWTDYDSCGIDYDIFYKYKIGGCNWDSTEVVSMESTSGSFNPSMCVDNSGTVHVTWTDHTNYGSCDIDGDIFYKYKTSDDTWSITRVLSTESKNQSDHSSICVDDYDRLHVVWEDWTDYDSCGGDYDIFYKYKPSGGVWSGTEVVSTESTNNSQNPSMCVDDSGTVHVVWSDYTDYDSCGSDPDIFYMYKTSGGNWSNIEVVSTESTNNSRDSSMCVDNSGRVHVIWSDYTDYDSCGSDTDIFYKYKPSGGAWSGTEVVSTESTNNSWDPSMCVDNSGRVHVVWSDYTDYDSCGSDTDIFYKYKLKNGSWSNIDVVSTESTNNCWAPSICVDNNDWVHIAWECHFSRNIIFYKYKLKDGTWSSTCILSTESTLSSCSPYICVDDNLDRVHVTWFDFTDYDGCGIDYDVFYKDRMIDEVEITDISSRFGQVTANIKAGDLPVDCSIVVDGNVWFGGEISLEISAHVTKEIYSSFTFGLGWVNITVKGNKLIERRSTFLLGPFFLRVEEK